MQVDPYDPYYPEPPRYPGCLVIGSWIMVVVTGFFGLFFFPLWLLTIVFVLIALFWNRR